MLSIAAQAKYSSLKTIKDGKLEKKFFTSHFGAENKVSYEDWQVDMPNNSMIVLQDKGWDGPDYAYKPLLRGGSVKYWVLMDNMDAGCVAGVYMVAVNDNCDVEKAFNDKEPQNQCPTIDLMQTNDFGFELSAHPCANGDCDARSMCEYKMRDAASKEYGDEAFGPGGTIINTNGWFQV